MGSFAKCRRQKPVHLINYPTSNQISGSVILKMKNTNRLAGFVLIELVSTLVLIGIIGAFTGFFLYYGINGFLASKRNSEDALKVQIAMDRISAELRDIKSTPLVFGTESVAYQSTPLSQGEGRILQIENLSELNQTVDGDYGSGIYLTVNGKKRILLNNVDLANSHITYEATKDLNNSGDGKNEISFIKVAFRLNDLGTPFEVRIYPRAMITFP
jgi:hypothetical protein